MFNASPSGAAVRYKIGCRSLTPERSVNLDASLRYATPDIVAEVSGFRNAIRDYIYVTPTGTRISNLDVYSYTQDDAVLLGGEFSVQARLTSAAHCGRRCRSE